MYSIFLHRNQLFVLKIVKLREYMICSRGLSRLCMKDGFFLCQKFCRGNGWHLVTASSNRDILFVVIEFFATGS
jgi:hypothetical protein